MKRFLLTAFILALGAPSAAAGSCKQIRFKTGSFSGDVSGSAPADGVVCYSLETGAGQSARVQILEGPNTMFGIDGVIDAQDDYRFTTRAGSYRINVSQLMRALGPEPFRMRVTVKQGRWRTGARLSVRPI